MTFDEMDRDVRLFVFKHFVENERPPSVAETAQALGLSLAAAAAAYDRLAAGRVIVLEPGTHHIRMANPLSAVQTAFPVAVGGKRYYGNCIWDALGVVAMLGGGGTIDASCGCCAESMPIEIADFELRPIDALVHFGVPAIHWWDDIVFT